MLMGGHYLKRDRFEGSQAMPASPSGGGSEECRARKLYSSVPARTAKGTPRAYIFRKGHNSYKNIKQLRMRE
jgi:hypothetical protein